MPRCSLVAVTFKFRHPGLHCQAGAVCVLVVCMLARASLRAYAAGLFAHCRSFSASF